MKFFTFLVVAGCFGGAPFVSVVSVPTPSPTPSPCRLAKTKKECNEKSNTVDGGCNWCQHDINRWKCRGGDYTCKVERMVETKGKTCETGADCPRSHHCQGRKCESCFPGDAEVEVFGKGITVMDHVNLGDKVRSARGWSKVFAFGKRDENSVTEYYQIQTASSKSLQISATHMIFVGSERKAVYPKHLKVGDSLVMMPSGEISEITSITTIERKGMYSLETHDGTLVVNGILVSCHVQSPAVLIGGYEVLSKHMFKHILYSPLRVACSISPSLCGTHNHDKNNGGHKVFPIAHNLIQFFSPDASQDVSNFLSLSLGLPVKLILLLLLLVIYSVEMMGMFTLLSLLTTAYIIQIVKGTKGSRKTATL